MSISDAFESMNSFDWIVIALVLLYIFGEVLASQVGKLTNARQLRELAGRKSFGRRESTYAEYKAEVAEARKSVGHQLTRASVGAKDMEIDIERDLAQPMPNSWKEQMERMPNGTEERSLTPVEEAPFKTNPKLEAQKDQKEVSRHRLTSTLALVDKDINLFRNITVNVDLKASVGQEELEGLEDEDLKLIEEQQKRLAEDKQKELELAKIEAILEKQLKFAQEEEQTEEAKTLIKKVKRILKGINILITGLTAIRTKNIEQIKVVVETINVSDCTTILKAYDSQMAQALAEELESFKKRCDNVLAKLEDIDLMKTEIEILPQEKIVEIKTISGTEPQVENIMRATFLLLGESPDSLTSRSDIRVLLGKLNKKSVKYRVENFEISSLDGKYKTVKAAKEICNAESLEQVKSLSSGTAIFLTWCNAIINAVESIF